MVAERTIVDITKGDGESHVDGRRRLIHYFLAKKQYKLNDRDMGTLEFERRISNNGNNMKLYLVPKVQGLCRRKHGKLPDTVRDHEEL